MPTDSHNIDSAKDKSSKRKAVSYGAAKGSAAQKSDRKVVPYSSGAAKAATSRDSSAYSKSTSSRSGRQNDSDASDGAKRSRRASGKKQTSTTKRHATKEQVKEEKQGRHARRSRDSKAQGEGSAAQQKGVRGALSRITEAIMGLNLAMRLVLLVVVLAVAAMGILYPIGCTYYQAMRQEQRYQAELDAVNARNDALQEENNALKTDEGVENQARKDLGWVKDGEQAVIISNSNESSESEMPNQVDSDDIHAPRTWYYDILDVIFQSNV